MPHAAEHRSVALLRRVGASGLGSGACSLSRPPARRLAWSAGLRFNSAMTSMPGARSRGPGRAEFAWKDGPVPAGLPVRQVHGWLADATGRVLVQDRVHEDRFLLAGGKSDMADPDWAHTLIREAEEESQVTMARDSIVYLGHQLVTGDPQVSGPYGQVRLFGVIEAFGAPACDPDSGHMYRRLMTSIPRAAELLAWGLAGELQSQAAAHGTNHAGR